MNTQILGAKKTRLRYIDVCKGILILLMIWYHVMPVMVKYIEDCNIDACEWISYRTRIWYDAFFMPAFFIITGYCSRFTENHKFFYAKIIKTIIIPVSIITYIRSCFFDFSFNPLHLIGPYKPNGNWFILALIIGRILFYEVKCIFNNIFYVVAIFLVLSFVAVLLNDDNIFINPFYWKQGLCAALFIAIGYCLRNIDIKNKFLIITSFLYIAIICIYNLLGYHHPVMVIRLSVYWYEFVPFVIMSLFGTAMVIFISKNINSNFSEFIETIGRQSLVVYLFQDAVIKVVGILLCITMDMKCWTLINCGIAALLIYIVTVLISYAFVLLFDTKIGKKILGNH